MLTTIETSTRQTVAIDSQDGRKLLRGIMRNPDQWRGRADDSTGWNLHFVRTIPGDVGEPDTTVTVATDCQLKPFGKTETTETIDGQTVTVRIPECKRIHFDRYHIAMVCRLLADRWTLDARYSFGSLNTSALGIGYHSITAHPDKSNHYQYVTVDTTTFQHGRKLTSGAMD